MHQIKVHGLNTYVCNYYRIQEVYEAAFESFVTFMSFTTEVAIPLTLFLMALALIQATAVVAQAEDTVLQL